MTWFSSNPIEMVWNQLKRYLAKKEPTTKDALVQHTMNFWYTEMSVETCNRYIDHNMPSKSVICVGPRLLIPAHTWIFNGCFGFGMVWIMPSMGL
jgi:hypothetical protein